MQAVKVYADFVGHERGRISAVGDEMGNEMLPDPFFGSKHQPPVAQRVVNLYARVLVTAQLQIPGGKV